VTGDYRRHGSDLFLPRYSLFTSSPRRRATRSVGFVLLRPWLRGWMCKAIFHEVPRRQWMGLEHGRQGHPAFGQGRRHACRVSRAGGQIPGGGYLMGRAFGWQTITTKIRVVADFDVYGLDQPINGYDRSFFGSGSLVL